MTEEEIIANKPDDTATHYVYDVDVYFSTLTGTYFDKTTGNWVITDFLTEVDLLQNYSRILRLN
ncbi:hypothetical protein A9988_09705 [Acinetobacter calcoaceticus]|nr:hypothetical protein A9988_09705 [Acinetobacter calcoaceticus]